MDSPWKKKQDNQIKGNTHIGPALGTFCFLTGLMGSDGPPRIIAVVVSDLLAWRSYKNKFQVIVLTRIQHERNWIKKEF